MSESGYDSYGQIYQNKDVGRPWEQATSVRRQRYEYCGYMILMPRHGGGWRAQISASDGQTLPETPYCSDPTGKEALAEAEKIVDDAIRLAAGIVSASN